MSDLMSKANMNEFLVDYMGFDPEEMAVMPAYVKEDIIEEHWDTFKEYILGEDYE